MYLTKLMTPYILREIIDIIDLILLTTIRKTLRNSSRNRMLQHLAFWGPVELNLALILSLSRYITFLIYLTKFLEICYIFL